MSGKELCKPIFEINYGTDNSFEVYCDDDKGIEVSAENATHCYYPMLTVHKLTKEQALKLGKSIIKYCESSQNE